MLLPNSSLYVPNSFVHRFIAELEYIADYFGSNYKKYVDVLESRHYPFNSKLALMTYISNFLIRPAELRGMCPLFFDPPPSLPLVAKKISLWFINIKRVK